MRSLFLSLLLTLAVLAAGAQRVTYSINETWRFHKGEAAGAEAPAYADEKWEIVTLPHTWNAQDADDDTPGYYRGVGWYRKHVRIGEEAARGQTYIYFEGANQETDLYVNGRHAGHHTGGYTRFCFDITELIRPGQTNVLAVKVDNKDNPDIPPLSADFTFFGGIYRDVYLIHTPAVHISTTDCASSGVYITTPEVSERNAEVNVRTLVDNHSGRKSRVRVENTVYAPDGTRTVQASTRIEAGGGTTPVVQEKMTVPQPALWSPDAPNLYRVVTRLYDDRTGALLDEVVNPLGLRWFEFSADKGFFLNGKHLKLIGTNRHQDYLGKGWALDDIVHVQDVRLLKAMGGNYLRVAHYPQDPVVMEMCDKLGILTSVEIPVVDRITENAAFEKNCLDMAVEMVRQDFNRPSVVVWAYMNEVMLRPPFKGDSVRHAIYGRNVAALARKIENTIRREDPSRYTMLPCHGSFPAYDDAGLLQIPMIVGWNLYQGWYSDTFPAFDRVIDRFHQRLPDKPLFITEYGADVDPRLHSFAPQRFDYSAEYANLYHRHYVKAIMERDFIASATIWNLNDFYSESRGNAVPHVNNKGINGLDRRHKDTYLLYKARFNPEPATMIGNAGWRVRGGAETAPGECTQPVDVYSNAKTVTLCLNGKSLGERPVRDFYATFDVPFADGINTLEATGDNGTKDLLRVDFRLVRRNPGREFRELNVMLGSQRYFEDREHSQIWIPEQAYTPGSWGYVGGKPYGKPTRHGAQPASDNDIYGTRQDPLFQTQRVGLEAFRADVPDGQYALYLYLAELEGDPQREPLAYNLGGDAVGPKSTGKRVFDISVNGTPVLTGLNIAEEFGASRAVVKKVIAEAADGKGLTVSFGKREGEPVLNAIRIYRIY